MRTVRVFDPTHTEWAVRVVWAPRHRALFRRIGAWRRNKEKSTRDDSWLDYLDFPAGGGDGCAQILLILVAVVVASLLLWWVVIPVLLLLLDILIVFVLLLLGLAARILIRRPWSVEAASASETHSVEVIGWHRALRARDGIANGLKTGGAAAWPSLSRREWD